GLLRCRFGRRRARGHGADRALGHAPLLAGDHRARYRTEAEGNRPEAPAHEAHASQGGTGAGRTELHARPRSSSGNASRHTFAGEDARSSWRASSRTRYFPFDLDGRTEAGGKLETEALPASSRPLHVVMAARSQHDGPTATGAQKVGFKENVRRALRRRSARAAGPPALRRAPRARGARRGATRLPKADPTRRNW